MDDKEVARLMIVEKKLRATENVIRLLFKALHFHAPTDSYEISGLEMHKLYSTMKQIGLEYEARFRALGLCQNPQARGRGEGCERGKKYL